MADSNIRRPEMHLHFRIDLKAHSDAVPFDVYEAGGSGHERDHRTFETLCHRFGTRDKGVTQISAFVSYHQRGSERLGESEAIWLDAR
jgi:hypothetical protein